jgi:hypothetical protein
MARRPRRHSIARLVTEPAIRLAWRDALAGESYAPLHIDYDDYGPTASLYGCASIEEENGCQVDVGELCLRCVDATAPTLLCEGP